MKSIKKNYLYNLFYQILILVTPLITAPYLARVLGADGIGNVSYAEAVVSYFVLFATMGMTTFGQREISYVQDKKEKRTQIFWETCILEAFTVSIVLICYLVFAFRQNQAALYLVLVFNILSVLANVTWFFQGIEEFGKIVFRNTVFKVINIAYVFLFIKSKEDVVWYLFGASFFSFLSNVSLWFFLPKYIGKPDWKSLKPFRHMKTIVSLFIPTVAIQVYTVLDKVMIGRITQDVFENGYYEQAVNISKMVLTLVTALGTVMVPRIGYYFEKKEYEEVKKLMYKSYRFVWFLGVPLCFGLIIVSSNFVPWFFGEGYDKVIPLLNILSLLILSIGISNVTGILYLIPTKKQNILTVTVAVGAIVNFILNLVLIRHFSSIGAAIASVTAETIIAIVQLIIVRKQFSLWKVLCEGKHYFIAGIVMLVSLSFIENKLSPSIFHTMLLILCGGVMYIGVLVLFKDEFLFSNISRVLERLKFVKNMIKK